MKLATVIPITKGVFRQELSYFTSKNIEPGTLVMIPVRQKTVPALVISSQDIKKIKTDIRKLEFSLKAIKDIGSKNFLKPEFIEACREIADYFISPLGAVIKDFVPQAVLGNNSFVGSYAEAPGTERRHYEIILFQQPREDRLQSYKSIIREEFAKNHSVFFCVPTAVDIEMLSSDIKKGIEKYTVTLHAGMPGKKIRELWNYVLKEEHPLLIIATRSFLSIPRNDLGTLIIEREGSSFYKLQARPYLDIRKAAEIIASKLKMRLILGDNIIRTETFYRNRLTNSHRILSGADQILVDMKKNQFQIISLELEKILKEAIEKNEHIILFINRRGYTSITVCNDCLRPILCEKCDSPLVIHKDPASRKVKLICHKCLTETIVPDQCPYCQSWHLQSLGVGIQKVAEEILKKFPNAKLFRMDSDIIKTKKSGDQVVEKFFNTPGAILIGTEMIFSYINKPVEKTAVVFIDALFTLPDFRINEKIFQILLRLRSLAKKTFLIQTRLANHKIFDDVVKGNVSSFYKSELEAKKHFQYPPFKTFIKITKEGRNKEAIKREVQVLTKKLEKWEPLAYSAFIPKIKNQHIWHIIIKLDPETWPQQHKELRDILSSLTPDWKINVDPESLL
ncbi:primosomal protein N' [Patescibacteria group bacterium]|nr:primosomal protein N' [Patescibacteria group bacterium]MBU2219442.1 primosomal protein N' [Patescibacteria group bacterium]MBU2263605.1 primosomal protein N' [Patescibacteria group bacterium]